MITNKNLNKMKKLSILIALFLINSPALFAETATVANINSIITKIYMQAVMLGLILAALTMIIVSIRDYDLVDSRARKQKDVLMRRIIFFTLILSLPTLWFFTTGSFMYNALASTLTLFGAGYNWDPNASWIGMKLISAYTVNGTIILTSCYIVFYVLFSWIWKHFLNKYKAWTVIYSNHKILGLISLNKKNN